MNYTKIYEQLIDRSKNRIIEGYTEIHHIVPKCMGGDNAKENLVALTPEEHYVAHQLLVKIYPENFALKKAAAMMVVNRPSNKLYGWIRREFSKAQSHNQSGSNNSQYGTRWIHNKQLRKCKKIKKNEPIPEGWEIGSVLKWENKKKDILTAQKKCKLQCKINELRNLHEIYIKEGFDGVKKIGYKFSKPNLVAAFAKYLEEFLPQNGKKRK